MASKLKMIATPIGNIRDISLRALDEIKKADLILAEDTRNSKNLFAALNIALKEGAKFISCHSQVEKKRADLVKERLSQNDSVILMSDAGCPAISDPGSILLGQLIEAGFDCEIIPGPSAITASVMGAGIDCTRFSFLGFLPRKKGARKKLIVEAAKSGFALILYESPLRLAPLLNELSEYLGARRVVVAREISKLHETFHRGVLGQDLVPPLYEKGECVVIVEAGPKNDDAMSLSDDEVEEIIREELSNGLRTKAIVDYLVSDYGFKKTNAYQRVLKVKGS